MTKLYKMGMLVTYMHRNSFLARGKGERKLANNHGNSKTMLSFGSK